MQDLRLIGVHEDGQHLLLDADDGTRFRVPLSDDLRAAVRRARPHHGDAPTQGAVELRPRDVQALIRAGASAEEVADQAGWPVDKVHRYEGPILAEREHVATLARGVRVRGRAHAGVAPTLESRISERLRGRGVDPSSAVWDAQRAEHGPWTVVVTFPAGGRERQARWHLDVPDRTITSLDDEARWLSGDDDADSAGPLPSPRVPAPGRSTRVYDVEAEGGLRATPRAGADDAPARPSGHEDAPGDPAPAHRQEEPVDLMTAMRERSAAARASRRSRRRGSRRSPSDVPGDQQPPEDALPLEHIPYEQVTSDVPPAAHADPDPDGPDGRPEPEARADFESADTEAPAPESTGFTVSESARSAETGTSDTEAPAPESTGSGTGTSDTEPAGAPGTDQSGAGTTSKEAQATEPAAEPEPAAAPTRHPGATDDARPAEPEDAEEPSQSGAVPVQESGDERSPQQPKGAKRKASRKSGRPSVPSWDDIMFGSRPGSD